MSYRAATVDDYDDEDGSFVRGALDAMTRRRQDIARRERYTHQNLSSRPHDSRNTNDTSSSHESYSPQQESPVKEKESINQVIEIEAPLQRHPPDRLRLNEDKRVNFAAPTPVRPRSRSPAKH